MDIAKRLETTQCFLERNQLDGWLLLGFHNLNSICTDFLELPSDLHQTRRFLYFVPKQGMPKKIVHAIEKHLYEAIPGHEVIYKSLEDWDKILKELLTPLSTIACDYSPMGEIPTLSKLDAGMFEKIRSLGVNIVSSGEIISEIFGILTLEQIGLHKKAAQKLSEIFAKIPFFIKENWGRPQGLFEGDIQEFIVHQMEELHLYTEDLPICAVGPNTSYPHYHIEGKGKKLEKGYLLLVDMWGKERGGISVFADMTQMYYLGERVDLESQKLFELTLKGQQVATDTIETLIKKREKIRGSDIDFAVRSFFKEKGMEDFVFHRLGHSIERKLHGRGPNLDSFETKDTRSLVKGMLFSIEPGLYVPGKRGVRLEINALIDDHLEITSDRQMYLPAISL